MYPFIELFGIQFPSFYVVQCLNIVLIFLIVLKRAKEKDFQLRDIVDLYLLLLVFGFIGARALHVMFEFPEYYAQDLSRVWEFWNGGLVFYGGLLLATLVGLLFLKWRQIEILPCLDLLMPTLSLAYAVGRLGCFLAGCCYGRFCTYSWAVDGRHPTQLYAFAWDLGVFFILIGIEKKLIQNRTAWPFGTIAAIWAVLHGTGRFIMEYFRDDFRGPQLTLSISSWISLCLVGIGIVFLYKNKKTISFDR